MTPLWFLNVLGTLWIDPDFGILIPVIHWEGLWDRDMDRACCCRAHGLLFCWEIEEWQRAPQGTGHLDAWTDTPFAERIEKKSLSSGETSENRLYNVPRIPRNPEMASLKWKTRILITYLWFPAIRFFWKCGQNLSRDLWKSSYSGDFDEAIIFVVSRRAELPVSDRVK